MSDSLECVSVKSKCSYVTSFQPTECLVRSIYVTFLTMPIKVGHSKKGLYIGIFMYVWFPVTLLELMIFIGGSKEAHHQSDED